MRVRIALFTVAIVTVILALSACKKSGGGGASPLLANMSGAVGIAITKASGSPAFTGFAAAAQTTGQAFSEIVKIDASGNITPILDQTRPAYHAFVTATHVIVSGDFHGVVDVSGNSLDCYLAAIPRSASGEPIKCLLSGDPLDASYAGSDPTHPDANRSKYGDKPGFITLGTTAYFAQIVGLPNGGGGSDATSEFRRWVGGSDQTELLIHLNAGGGGQLVQPFAVDGAPNVCVAAYNAMGQMFCGATNPGTNWMDMGLSPGDYSVQAHLIGRNVVLGDGHAIRLDDLTVTSSGVASTINFPTNWDLTATTFDGRIVGISQPGTTGVGSIVLVDSSANVTVVDSTIGWSRMIADGNYGYFYGGSQLRRFDRATATLGTANLLGSTGMLQVTDMSFSSANRIRLDGTAASGSPVVVAIDASSGAITVSDASLPRFQEVTPLQ